MKIQNQPSKMDHALRRSLLIGGQNVSTSAPDGNNTNSSTIRYPYYCSIDKKNGVIVSGALIAPDIVLSAGHVAEDNMGSVVVKCGAPAYHPAGDVNTNTSNTTTTESTGVSSTQVIKWVYPSNFLHIDPFIYNDYLLLKLVGRYPSTDAIRLNPDPAIPADASRVQVMGVGWTHPTIPSPSSVLQSVTLQVMANTDCQNIQDPLRPQIDYARNVNESMICTQSPDPRVPRDACAWDSGDPVIVKSPDDNDPQNDLLVGLGSSGVSCADPVFPGLQARISYGYEWIRKQVCTLSDDPPAYFCCSDYMQNTTTAGDAQVVMAPPFNTSVPEASPVSPEKEAIGTGQQALAELISPSRQFASPVDTKYAQGPFFFVVVVLFVLAGLSMKRKRKPLHFEYEEQQGSRSNPKYIYGSMDRV